MITIRKTDPGRYRCGEQGFTMIEMLVAAFMTAIGILGLTTLQTMSMRSRTGSKSLTTAVLVGQGILDQAEALGRNSLLCARNSAPVPTLSPNYFGAGPPSQYYNFDGTAGTAGAYFTVNITTDDVVTPVSKFGGIKLLTVDVLWSETLNATGTAVPRHAIISRRIAYATS